MRTLEEGNGWIECFQVLHLFNNRLGLSSGFNFGLPDNKELLPVRTRILKEDVTKEKIAMKVGDNNLVTG